MNGLGRTASTTARAGLGLELRLVPLHLVERGLEGLPVLGAEGLDGPVLLRSKRADLPLALDDQSKRDRLHPSGRKPRLDAVPQDGAGLVADEPIENPARLLRIHLPVIDLSRLPERLLDGVLRDLVEQDSVGGDVRLELIGNVPGDRFAFAIGVGCQVDG